MGGEWSNASLGELLKFSNGKTSPERNDSSSIPVYGSNGIIGYANEHNSPKNSIIIGRVGSYCGSVYHSPTECWVTDNAIKATAINSNSPKFLFYLLGHLELNQWREGSGQPLLNQSILKNIDAAIPCIDEQKALAHILGTLDDKIELNRRMNVTLEAMARALFKSWFVDFDPVIDNALAAGNPIPEPLQTRANAREALGDQRKPLPEAIQKQFPSRFVLIEEMDLVPEGWSVMEVGDVMQRLKVKKRYKKKDVENFGEIPVFEQGSDILLGYHNGNAEVMASENEPAFIFGDHTCVMKLSTEPFSISENVIALRGRGYNTFWAYYAVLGKQSFEEYRRHWMEFIVKNVVIPSDQLAKSYAVLIADMVRKQSQLARQITQLTQTRDTLLPKLISGQLRIPDAEKLVADAV